LPSPRGSGVLKDPKLAVAIETSLFALIFITTMTTMKPIVLIDPEILQRVQDDIDKDLEFKKVSW
jgi:hypothetical protein